MNTTPGHLELTDLYAEFTLRHPEAAALIEENRASVLYHLTHNQKVKKVTHSPVQTEIGKHFETWIKDSNNRKKFDALMPSDKFLIVSALYLYNIPYTEPEWQALYKGSANQFTNDMRMYTGKQPHHTDSFRRALKIDGFLDDKGEITAEGFGQINRILGR